MQLFVAVVVFILVQVKNSSLPTRSACRKQFDQKKRKTVKSTFPTMSVFAQYDVFIHFPYIKFLSTSPPPPPPKKKKNVIFFQNEEAEGVMDNPILRILWQSREKTPTISFSSRDLFLRLPPPGKTPITAKD